MPIYFRGRQRLAALHIIERTPLGDSLVRVGEFLDDGDLITIDVSREGRASLSNGERELLKFLASLAGQDAINLWGLFEAIDRDCQLAVLDALGISLGLVNAEGVAA